MSRLVIILLTLLISTSLFAEDGDSLKHDSAETWGWRSAMISSLMLTLLSNPAKADEVSVSSMVGPKVAGLKVAFRWHPEETIAHFGDVRLKHYYMFAYNYWQATAINGQAGVNNVVEASPVFRFNWSNKGLFSFAETSVGIAMFSRTELDGRQFSTHFQFANSLAFGGYLSEATSWSLQLQHYSNNSIKLPNNGINFYNFNVAYRY